MTGRDYIDDKGITSVPAPTFAFSSASRVTPETISKVCDPLFTMLTLNAGRVVLMAAVARVDLVIGRTGVTGRAGNDTTPTVIERESMGKGGTLPGAGGVALGTVGAKLAPVNIRLGVAGHARLWNVPKSGDGPQLVAATHGYALPEGETGSHCW
jgi:hypothetical protein